MLAEMSAETLCKWQQYAAQRPFGFIRDSRLSARLCAVVANFRPMGGGKPIGEDKFLWKPATVSRREKSSDNGESLISTNNAGTVIDVRKPRKREE